MSTNLVHDYVADCKSSGLVSLPAKIKILDATLTEGEQCPGLVFSPDEKLEIARKLAEAGVHAAYVGFPAVSREEKRATKRIINEKLGFETWGLCRVVKRDIDELIDVGTDVASFIAPSSRLHYMKRLKLNLDEYLTRLAELTDYTLSHGMAVSVGLEDSSRAEIADIERICKALEGRRKVGLLLTDTVGTFTPSSARLFVDRIERFWKKTIALHFHDDFGMATANTLAAIEGGGEEFYLYVTVNGIGERCGAASLEETCTALKVLYQYDTGIALKKLPPLCALVEKYSGIPIIPIKSIVGHNAFTHETGPHVHGILIDPLTYERIPIKELGLKRRIVFGKHSGRSLIKAVLDKNGLKYNDSQLEKIQAAVKELHEKKDRGWKRENARILDALHQSIMSRSTTEEEMLAAARSILKNAKEGKF